MMRESKFSIKEIAQLWEITIDQAKYALKKRVYRLESGVWVVYRKEYKKSNYNPGWNNLKRGKHDMRYYHKH
jgi:hypothetical protein